MIYSSVTQESTRSPESSVQSQTLIIFAGSIACVLEVIDLNNYKSKVQSASSFAAVMIPVEVFRPI